HRALSEHKTLSISWSHYPNLKEIAAKSKLTDTTVSIPITASYYVYDTNKIKSGALEATALINVKYD
ncbi:fimbrial protein, partial [Escherichia coli]|uniref:fimbrial protein n=1 Tax=Escherichia coli TaxID=562 RepID=UPI0022E6B67E